MYGELVKSLRNMSKMGNRYGMAAVKMNEAADAIEDLCGLAASQSKDCSEAVAKYLELWAKQPRWIPVSERLPEKEDMVIFHYAWTGRTGTVYKEVTLATLAELEHVGSKPLAWMPLPTPPKEET